ncbi:hypothetical protein [Nocardia stercoris]|uniref:Ig-like domain repeat protein n=1 Tax=Nocardia stercoris TaxID=2483361 RepID=A0A3M2LE39_9NOCA|nr:hypothetical protein [Nocardia stercoris]RMI35030.1 hypothetical protein EBN03_01465 [Nocardia stercoris]
MRNSTAGRVSLALTGFAVTAAAATLAAPTASADASANGIAVPGTANDYYYTGQTYMMTIPGTGNDGTCTGTLVDATGATHPITMTTQSQGGKANQGTIYFAWTPQDIGVYTFSCTADAETFGPVNITVTDPPGPNAWQQLLTALGSSSPGATATIKDGQVQGEQKKSSGSSAGSMSFSLSGIGG